MITQRADTGNAADVSKDTLELADAAAEKLKAATDRAQEIAGIATEHAKVYRDQAQDLMRRVKPFIEKSIKEQPMATLAVAAAVGAVLGALWKK